MDIAFKIWKLIPTYGNLGYTKITIKRWYFSFRYDTPYAVYEEENYILRDYS